MGQNGSAAFVERDLLTRPGSWGVNEDRVGGGPNYLYVIDGATGLAGEPAFLRGRTTAAAWFVRETARWLDWQLPWASEDLEEILARGMARILGRWQGEQEALPTAGIALLRLRRGQVEAFALGDCPCSIRRRDGSFVNLEETALRRLDQWALEELTAWANRLDRPPADCLPLIRETLRAHRGLCNRPGGYWALDPTGAGLPHARRLALPAEDCRSVFLCTDGYGERMAFSGMSLAELHVQTERQGTAALADRLFSLQARDPTFRRVPRFKLRDDTSAAWARVQLR